MRSTAPAIASSPHGRLSGRSEGGVASSEHAVIVADCAAKKWFACGGQFDPPYRSPIRGFIKSVAASVSEWMYKKCSCERQRAADRALTHSTPAQGHPEPACGVADPELVERELVEPVERMSVSNGRADGRFQIHSLTLAATGHWNPDPLAGARGHKIMRCFPGDGCRAAACRRALFPTRRSQRSRPTVGAGPKPDGLPVNRPQSDANRRTRRSRGASFRPVRTASGSHRAQTP